MVRTNVVSLSSIKGIAYRQKLPSGGSGIVILREDAAQPGIAAISKTSGEAILTANTPKKLYPQAAFQEAIALTAGLPYRKQGSVNFKGEIAANDAVPEEKVAEETVVDSAEYRKIIDRYTDKDGKLSYALLNKDLIKFAHSSSVVRKMLAAGESVSHIRQYAVGSKFRSITGNSKLTDAQIKQISALLDEVSPKGVFKEFEAELRKKLKAGKQK